MQWFGIFSFNIIYNCYKIIIINNKIVFVSPFFCPKKGWVWPFVGPRSAPLKDPISCQPPHNLTLPFVSEK